ncbi:MAG: sulfatase [Sphingobacteriales bacterium]|nr:sulfatase [Sphingobacteriales bacterium]
MQLLFLLLFFSVSSFAQQKPNIIYIMSDDHDADAISAYNKKFISTPNIDRLAKEGMLFTKSFVANSICGPARATLLTGQHSHKNGMKDNRTRFDSSKMTMPKILQQNGYQTAIVGKWHLVSYPTGFDYWKILPGQGLYYDPRMINMQGDTTMIKGYAPDVITDEAITWLDNRNMTKPFLLLYHHKAPHRNFIPKLKWLEVFSKKIFSEPATLFANMNEHGQAWRTQKMSILKDMTLFTDLKVDPAIIPQLGGFTIDSADIRGYNAIMNRIPESDRKQMKEMYAERGKQLLKVWGNDSLVLKLKYQWYIQDYMACVASVDENVGRLLDYLDKNNLTKNTVVIYTGDQGMYLGENGWFDKRWMYDVSMQSPLLIRWSGKIKAGTVTNQMVQNIDYAPTFLDIAGSKIPTWVDGISLKPLLTGQQKTLARKNLYYHYYEYPIDHYVVPHLGIRGERYKLIYFYTVNEWEFYDLKTDPDEQNNLIQSAEYKSLILQMKNKLLDLRNKYNDHEPAGELN